MKKFGISSSKTNRREKVVLTPTRIKGTVKSRQTSGGSEKSTEWKHFLIQIKTTAVHIQSFLQHHLFSSIKTTNMRMFRNYVGF